jgi:hypothetical protein
MAFNNIHPPTFGFDFDSLDDTTLEQTLAFLNNEVTVPSRPSESGGGDFAGVSGSQPWNPIDSAPLADSNSSLTGYEFQGYEPWTGVLAPSQPQQSWTSPPKSGFCNDQAENMSYGPGFSGIGLGADHAGIQPFALQQDQQDSCHSTPVTWDPSCGPSVAPAATPIPANWTDVFSPEAAVAVPGLQETESNAFIEKGKPR